MRISTHHVVIMAACLVLLSGSLAGCKKKHKPDFSTPLGIVNSYVWAIDHHDCSVLEKVVTGKFKRHLEKRGKEGCHHIMKAYGKHRGKTKFADVRVVKTGDPTLFYEEEGRAIVALPLTRQDRDEVAYFDLEKTERGWQVVGENAKPPRWYSGPAPQLNRPDIRPDAPPAPGPAVGAPPPSSTPVAPPPPPEPATTAPPAATIEQPVTPPASESAPSPTTAPPAPPITEKGAPHDMGEEDSHGPEGHDDPPPTEDEPEGDDP